MEVEESMMKSVRFILLILCAAMAFGSFQCRAHAAGFYQNPNITLSPDKMAWTVHEELPGNTDPGNQINPACWYPKGTRVLTNVKSSLHEPETGEHLYRYKRKGLVPVGGWEVVFRAAKCIHPDFPAFHGMQFVSSRCYGCYYSAWNAWCADCGEPLDSGHIYMSRNKIQTVTKIDLNLDYYYCCPSCGHLEQGRGIFHECQGVSANRYKVVYHANADDALGSVEPSFHIYGNSDVYEGEEVTPVKKLNQNNFTRTGYCFLGWNTRPEGNGQAFQDGQEILNLTSENYDAQSSQGTVDLYAQWKKIPEIADLVLSAEVNLTANGGRGAVDLKWSQPDENRKVYLVYQKRKGEKFVRVCGSDGEETLTNSSSAGEALTGEENRDGYACAWPVNVGFQDAEEMMGTKAADLQAPDRIDADGIKKELAGDGMIRLSFNAPKDKGTVYYHQVESYLKDSEKLLRVSNITETEVITGVVGFYYRIDGEKETEVTAANADNKENLLTATSLVIKILDCTQYLHLAAVDRAGNVGESLTVRIMPEDIDVAWKLHTEQMQADCVLGDLDYGSVADAGERAYYVRADGKTPFLLKYAGTMDGIPRKNYQIDRGEFCFCLTDPETKGQYTVLLPCGRLLETEETDARQWKRQFSGTDILQPSVYGKAFRIRKGKRLEICHSFTLDQKYHGKTIVVYPKIGAAFGDNIEFSDGGEDIRNRITIIGDGQAPQINGMENFKELLTNDFEREKNPVLDLSAEDELSGVQSFYAVLRNLDLGGEISCYPDGDGHIRIDLSEDNPLLLGNLKLTVYAKDRVGNERILEDEAVVFGLSARIVRMLPPYLPEFKRGESGWLQVTVWGYAERLEIQFPEEFASEDPSLNQIFEYAVPKESQKEEIAFMVPLYLEKSKEYQITVRAFKGDGMLERRPVLCTLRVEDTVLDEIRTRLR